MAASVREEWRGDERSSAKEWPGKPGFSWFVRAWAKIGEHGTGARRGLEFIAFLSDIK
jgi:hypothetical protein